MPEAIEEVRTPIRTALARGLRRRCPRCGIGPLFRRGIKTYERCPSCDLQYQRDRGDTWLFMIITDRIPILFGIAAVYLGFRPETPLAIATFFGVIAVPVLATLRERQGMALALDYIVTQRLRA